MHWFGKDCTLLTFYFQDMMVGPDGMCSALILVHILADITN